MRKCLLCGTESDGATCPADGEASWAPLVIGRGYGATWVGKTAEPEPDPVIEPEPIASPEPDRAQTSRRKRRN